jgi:cytochrome c
MLSGVLLLAPAGAQAGADAKAGERTFAQCRACHKVAATGTSGIGPNLYGVAGRHAGTLPGFRYSPSMVAANRVWTDANLDAYLAAPARAVPGGRMAYVGLRNPVDRRNVLAYLKSVSR